MTQEVIESLVAQLETSKQMFNEGLNNLYQVRLNNHILNNQVIKLNKQIEELTKQLADEKAKTASVSEGATEPCL
jgi:hypothetical protein